VAPVETARQMQEAVEAALPAEIAVMAAAVGDWRVARQGAEKLKKGAAPPHLSFVENPDILAGLAHHRRRPRLLIGFAAETERLIENAQAKLRRKGCDWIVANDVSAETGIMGGERNRVNLVTADGVEEWPDLSKQEVAERLVCRIGSHFAASPQAAAAPPPAVATRATPTAARARPETPRRAPASPSPARAESETEPPKPLPATPAPAKPEPPEAVDPALHIRPTR
jgi:phosphopantothenoylcysteine decarboxylase/phosphopantothenate--cysteine ligase